MPQQGIMSILFEFTIKDLPSTCTDFSLAKGFVNYEIPRHKIKTQYVQRLIFERKITREPVYSTPPTKILNALTMLNLYFMQERAREEMANGDINSATRHMENLAMHLLRKGEDNLAQTVLEEVAYINKNRSYSTDGEKRLKYGTRSLLLTAGNEERK
jgi:Ca-activated chloride channel family protein